MSSSPRIKVVGVGGAGCNTLSRLASLGLKGLDLVAVNTDTQALSNCPVSKKILIGEKATGGMGAGMDYQLGEKAARESYETLKEALVGSEIVFMTAGFGGGCLRGSSSVFTNPEGPVRIDSIKPGATVYTFSNNTLVKRKVLAAMKTGIKKVLELKTNNRTICASEDHPFLRVKPSNSLSENRFSKFTLEWSEVRDLNIGDLVVVSRRLPDEGKPLRLPDNSFTDEKFCQLFGFLLGDGWISKIKRGTGSWKIFFSPSPDEQQNLKYLSLFKEVLGLEMRKGKGANWYYGSSKEMGGLLEKLGLHKRATEKEIPKWVFSLPEPQKKALIIGLADADGSYSVQVGGSGLPKKEIKFEMSSEKLIRGLKALCDGIGLRISNVTSRKRVIKAPNSKKEKLCTSWMVRIYKTHELTGVMPHPKARSGVGFLYKFRTGPRDGRVPEFFRYFGFNRIKSIKEVGDEEVYDITVEGSHNFIADGFVVHNTGSSATPIIGEISKSLKILTVAVITLPFSFEGAVRQRIANSALRRLRGNVDAYLCIANDRVLKIISKSCPVSDAFLKIDAVLSDTLQGISDLLSLSGIISLDFADLEELLRNSGRALFGVASAKGEQRAITAASRALESPLLDLSIKKAKGLLFNIRGKDLALFEIKSAADFFKKIADKRTKIIFGVSENEALKDGEIKITLIATGVE